MKTKYLFMVLLCTAFASCKKDDPAPPILEPAEFYFTGIIDGVPDTFRAGENDYYLFTFKEHDQQEVDVFAAQLAPVSCQSCNGLSVQLRNFETTSGGDIYNIDDAIYSGCFHFAYDNLQTIPIEGDSIFEVQFTAETANGIPSSYAWDFGDGCTSNESNPAHRYNREGVYHVCLFIQFSDGNSSSLCNDLTVKFPQGSLLHAQFTFQETASHTITVTNTSSGTISSVLWDFGDGNSSTQFINVTHDFLSDGIWKTSLTIHDTSGTDATFSKNVFTSGYTSGVANYNEALTSYLNPFNLSNAVVIWDASPSERYSSKNVYQPASSFFKVLSVEDYVNDKDGNPTRKIHTQFDCMLADQNGNSIHIQNADAVIALAY